MSISALDKFIRASDALIEFEASFNDLKDDTHSIFTLELHSNELKILWEKVKVTYDNCLDYLKLFTEKKSTEDASVSAKYRETYSTYVNCLSKINKKNRDLQLLDKCENTVNKNVSSESFHSLTLPPCDVEMFSGDYLSWPTFRDLFTALYINSSRISDIERLCHLLRKTSGEAKEIVSKCPLSNAGFDIAWNNLREAYENPRMLVNNQLKVLFNLKVVEKETFLGLKSLQRGINSCLSAMSIYEVSTEDWDPIIVFLCVQRLPDYTVTLWEQSIKDKFALPAWKDLDAFLTERIQTLECLRDVKETTYESKKSVSKLKAHHSNSSNSNICVLCKSPHHFLRDCQRFKNLSVSDRFSTVKKFHCCVNCLARTHEVKNCNSVHSCSLCNKRHHTMLHRNGSPGGELNGNKTNTVSRQADPTALEPSLPSTSRGITSSAPLNRHVFHVSQNRTVLLGTAMVNICHQGMTYPARALIDPGSETSFISEKLQNRLKISAHSTNAKISGVNQAISATSRKLCAIEIGSPLDSSIILNTTVLVLPHITGNLPSFFLNEELQKDLPSLRFADPNFFDCRPVDLLLGADLYPRIIKGGVQQNILGSLLAQETVFGWLITGPLHQSSLQVYSTRVDFSENDNFNLSKFWELEETPKKKLLTTFDKFCEENYKKTTRRNSEGRYVVTLPFKPEFPESINLGLSRPSVMGQFLRIESFLKRRPETKVLYDSVLNEYLDLSHMSLAIHNRENSLSCYLPHHPIIKPDRKTTKLRVVFNASNRTSNGNSLNDCLFVGPTLQSDLVLLILRWRLFRYVFNCDITQMYRQIRLDPAHTPFQRILFRSSPTEEIKEYELQTVTFGVNCAPYLAIRTLLQLANDYENEFPLAAHILRKSMYVDDVLTGAHDVSSAVKSRNQLVKVLSSAGFQLRKWTANEIEILRDIPSDYLVDSKLLTFVEASSSKTLGIQWNAQMDSFYFKVEPLPKKSTYTKREVLSAIAKLFDPVGWLGPIIVKAKIIMQKIWLDNIDWDDSLLPATNSEWRNFVSYYMDVNHIQIPRWVRYAPGTLAELHVFSDASEKAYAGAIYIRVEAFGKFYTNLLACKTKVAPIKSVSLPRLELCGAVLASELLKAILSEIDIPIEKVYCWTDSTIVLCWLRKNPCNWTTFVANRVCRIQENGGKHNWYHVKSEENPADLGSRGISPLELEKSDLWWHGPTWLREDKSAWKIKDLSNLDTDTEARSIRTHASFFSNYEDILERFSSFDRAVRVIAYIFRFFKNSHSAHKGKSSYSSPIISDIEIRQVKLRLAIVAQKVHFAQEYECLLSKRTLSSKSSLLSLNPFLDSVGVMRINGRLAKSPSLAYTERHPILLPYSCRFAQLLTEFVHVISIHGGNQLMLRILRIEYWIPRVKILISKVINHCKRCILERKRSCSQIMAALPPERTVLDKPFATTGVDFAGPFDMKLLSGRSNQTLKAYVCIFVCFSTKAIHLEATSDLSTDKFLAAFNRFISRRGCPSTIFSDNGTNFVGASRELERDFKTFLSECRARMCSTFGLNGLSWKFIPAGAPHMGGLWEAGVKSFKLHFKKEVQNIKYTFEELSTVLARIEACLNSRPLCPISENPDEPVALTPGHFLIGSPILAPPEPSIFESPISIINRYRKIKAFSHEICRRWKEEYLQSLHKRYKWKYPERDIAINDLVAIRHEQLSPTSWKLGRVVKTYPGSDDHVRVADIRTANGIVKRPITKLVVLTN